MADYAPNYTNRFRVLYTSRGQAHRQQWRYGGSTPAVPPVGLITLINQFLTDTAALRLTDWTVLGAEYSLAGSDFFLPAPTVPTAAAGTIVATSNGQKPVFLSWQGITSAGNRASLYLYGVGADPILAGAGEGVYAQDYRYTSGENAAATSATNVLKASAIPCGADGNTISWRSYVNIGVNSYYQRKQRG